eukprot:COSAG03_NODE_11131_length_610_cov_0.933464_2_plen_115_part_01
MPANTRRQFERGEEREKEREKERDRERGRQAGRQTDIQTRQTGRQAGRQAGRRAGGQAETESVCDVQQVTPAAADCSTNAPSPWLCNKKKRSRGIVNEGSGPAVRPRVRVTERGR